MPEQHPLAGRELPVADQVDQARRRLCRIDRVEKQALQLGKHADRLEAAFGRDAVTLADIVAIGDDIL